VRFMVGGREIGKLASDPAALVAKLLDLDLVVLTGRIVDTPDRLSLNDHLILTVEVHLPLHGQPSFPFSSFDCFFRPVFFLFFF